jgi:hypothetical protein
MEKVAGPGDGSRDSGQVTDNWWRRLELLILLLNGGDLQLVVGEKDRVFGVQVVLEVVTVENSLELAEKL